MKMKLKYTGLLSLFVLLLFAACTKDEGNGNIDFDRDLMLDNYANNIIIPAYQLLTAQADAFNNSVIDFTNNPTEQSLGDLRYHFNNLYILWQSAAPFHFGPAEEINLRASTNTYPANVELIEENIASGDYNLNASNQLTAIGLPALDYLLNSIDATDFDIVEKFKNTNHYSAYLNALSVKVKTDIDFVNGKWNSGYAETFVSANGTDVGSGLGMLINATTLHLEKYIRAGKVGIPLGIFSLNEQKPTHIEARYTNTLSKTLIKQSLSSLKTIFEGSNGLGIDDNLDAVGAQYNGVDLSITISNQIELALAKTDVINDSIEIALATQEDKVAELYTALQRLVVLMKVDMTSSLGILITYQDNDGD